MFSSEAVRTDHWVFPGELNTEAKGADGNQASAGQARVSAALGSSTQSQGWIFAARAGGLPEPARSSFPGAEQTCSPNSAPEDCSCAARGVGEGLE